MGGLSSGYRRVRRLTLLGLPALAGPLAAILLQCPYAEAQSARITRDAVAARIAKAPRIHPRLFLGRGAEAALKQKIAGDPLLARAVARLTVEADGILPAAPVEHKKIGRRLLDQSRRCLARMTRLTLAYRLTGERKYLDRARTEMLAAAAFSDWNPSHFLDVAEMTAALAIGYDWLYEDLDAETRAAIRAAIVEKGLKPSLEVQGGWVTGTNNWNQVCHGGMTLGALAVLEDEPELAADIIARAIDGLPHAMAEYAPDGAGSEGPGYWAYGTSYNVVLINALESVLGMDFGLSQAEGFLKTADYYLHAAGPKHQDRAELGILQRSVRSALQLGGDGEKKCVARNLPLPFPTSSLRPLDPARLDSGTAL